MDRALHVRLPDELAARIDEAAKEDRRSVSDWVRLTLEDALVDRPVSGPMPPTTPDASKVKRIVDTPIGPGCSHKIVRKEPGTSGGMVRVCQDCGARLLR